MKFKKEKLYRLVKDDRWDNCIGCILRYKGFDGYGHHCGTPVKAAFSCGYGVCRVFDNARSDPKTRELVEYESMVKFCKKLKKERSNVR